MVFRYFHIYFSLVFVMACTFRKGVWGKESDEDMDFSADV